MVWLWLIIAVILFAVSMYLIGRYASDEPDESAMMWTAGCGSLLWPLVLAVVIVLGPFFGLYYMGAKRAEKAKKDK